MRTSKARSILLAACFLLSALGASALTPDVERFWTTVGSAGTLDEKSEGKVFFDHAVVQKGDTLVIAPARRQPRIEGKVDMTDSAVIRYNVVAVDGLFEQYMIGMKVRFLDEGDAQVIAKLIEVDIATGAEVTRLTFDSDAAPVSSGYHAHEVFADCSWPKEPFDFVRKAYYIEATLTTSAIVVNSAAGIEIIQLHTEPCLP